MDKRHSDHWHFICPRCCPLHLVTIQICVQNHSITNLLLQPSAGSWGEGRLIEHKVTFPPLSVGSRSPCNKQTAGQLTPHHYISCTDLVSHFYPQRYIQQLCPFVSNFYRGSRKSLQAQRSGANVLMDYGVSAFWGLLTGFIGWEDELVTLYI